LAVILGAWVAVQANAALLARRTNVAKDLQGAVWVVSDNAIEFKFLHCLHVRHLIDGPWHNLDSLFTAVNDSLFVYQLKIRAVDLRLKTKSFDVAFNTIFVFKQEHQRQD